jgi:hypothetical protein
MGSPRHRRHLFGSFLLLAIAMAIAIGDRALAQSPDEQPAPVPQETIQFYVGDIFEILGTSDRFDMQYAWVLSKDKTFIQASRSNSFRVRLVQPAVYRLDVAAGLSDGTITAQRTFLLNIKPRPEAETETGALAPIAASGTLVTTDPMLFGTTAAVQPGRQVVKLTPARDDIAHLSAVMAAGGVQQDLAPSTFFASGQASLYLWLSAPASEHVIQMTGLLNDGTTLQQTIRFVQGSSQQETVIPVQQDETPLTISAESGGTLRFSIVVPPDLATVPLLFHWSFGDGTESLQSEPSHLYGQSGMYEVHAQAIDLTTGQTVIDIVRAVTVEAYGVSSSSSSAASVAPAVSSASSVSSKAAVAGGGTLPFGTIALFGLLFLLAVLLGAGAIWLVSFFLRRGSFEKRFEEAESRIMKKTATGTIDVAPPLSLKKEGTTEKKPEETQPLKIEEPPAAPAFTPEPSPPPPAAPPSEPSIDVEQAPAWLKKGLEKTQPEQPSPAPQQPVPPPSAEPEPAPPPAEPAPQPTPPAADVTQPAEEVVPPWLQQVPTEPAQPAIPAMPEPTPPVEPQPAPAPEPSPAPAPEPEPTPEPEPAPPIAEPEPTPPVEPEPPMTPVQPEPAPAPAMNPPPDATRKEEPRNAPLASQPQSPAAQSSADQQAREERERERKRLKRKRYRENLKKRKQTEPPVSAPSQPSAPAAQPAKTEPLPEQPVAKEQPAAAEPAPKQEEPPKAAGQTDDKVVFVVEAETLKKPNEPNAPSK